MTAAAGEHASPHDDTETLIARQYADRPRLRPVVDRVLTAASRVGDVRVVARRTQISLVGPLRTFAIVRTTARSRVDVALRLDTPPSGRLRVNRGEQYAVRLELRDAADVDREAVRWLQRAYDVNATPRRRRSPERRPKPTAAGPVHVVVEGVDLPGRSCDPDGAGREHRNVHVGLRCGETPPARALTTPRGPWRLCDLIPGDAPVARWDLDVVVRRFDAEHDVRGPFVRGPRGGRAISLGWVELEPDGAFRLFRGLGLRFSDVDPALLEAAGDPGMQLVARLGLTDAKGNPRCASVRPPDVRWSVEPR